MLGSTLAYKKRQDEARRIRSEKKSTVAVRSRRELLAAANSCSRFVNVPSSAKCVRRLMQLDVAGGDGEDAEPHFCGASSISTSLDEFYGPVLLVFLFSRTSSSHLRPFCPFYRLSNNKSSLISNHFQPSSSCAATKSPDRYRDLASGARLLVDIAFGKCESRK